MTIDNQAELLPDEAAAHEAQARRRLTDELSQWQHAERIAETLGVHPSAVHRHAEEGSPPLEGFQIERRTLDHIDRSLAYWKRRRYKYRALVPTPDPAIARFAQANGLGPQDDDEDDEAARPTERHAEGSELEPTPTPTPATLAHAVASLLAHAHDVAYQFARYLDAQEAAPHRRH